jgi:hypothetical protein
LQGTADPIYGEELPDDIEARDEVEPDHRWFHKPISGAAARQCFMKCQQEQDADDEGNEKNGNQNRKLVGHNLIEVWIGRRQYWDERHYWYLPNDAKGFAE